MADKKYELEFGLSDGTSQKVEFTAPQGPEGAAGKTAYEYAKDGGYTGTESEFAAKLAADAVSITYDESTKTMNISSVSGGVTAELISELAGEYDVEKIVLNGVVLRLPSGADGYTPQKGVDYYTDADQEDIVQQVITALGTPVFGTVNDSNVITLNGELADGIYTIRYEDADGNYTTIGTLTNQEVTYTNALAIATDENGDIWNGVGYADGYRLQSYGGTTGSNSMAATEGYFATGLIPYTIEQLKKQVPFYVKGIELDLTNLPTYLRYSMVVLGSTGWYGTVTITDMSAIDQVTITQLGNKYYKFTPNKNAYTGCGWNKMDPTPTHIRFSMPGSGAGVIITVNEPIE